MKPGDLKTLSELRRKCQLYWYVGAVLLLLLLVGMCIGGRFLASELPRAWLWAAVVALPGALLLWAASTLKRPPSKLFPLATARILIVSTIIYQATAMITLCFHRFGMDDGTLLIDYMERSYYWLVPLELMVLAMYSAHFLFQGKRLAPNTETLRLLAMEKSTASLRQNTPFRRQCFEKIADADLGGAFDLLRDFFDGRGETRASSDVVMLQGEWTELTRNVDLGVLDRNTAQIQINRITVALMNLIEQT